MKTTPTKERYALIGTGSRARLYFNGINTTHSDVAELIAWSDNNPGRIDYYERAFAEAGYSIPGRYAPEDFERMIRDEKIDRVIVTTPDFTHAEYVSRALLAGADVVVEKPLTINEEGVRMIDHAMKVSGHSVVTTFNYRYSPRNSALKELIASGAIGQVTSAHFEWVLDTVHGADYFRRWHRYKDKSGGLLVHKASHHFDLVNWWLDAAPKRVFASGGLRFYGAKNAAARGLGKRPERGTGSDDPFSLDLNGDPRLKGLYLDNEKLDGYIRDRDPFDEGITIEDNVAVIVDYDSGATLSYALNAHSPWEGYRIAVNGTEGRAELTVIERAAVVFGEDGRPVLDPSAIGQDDTRERLTLQRHWEEASDVPIPQGVGGHGGGDASLVADVFNRVSVDDDPLHRPAGFESGLRAISVGIAANRSLETGLPVLYTDLAFTAE